MKFKYFFFFCVGFYLLLAVNYYYTQSRPFDPWLQFPPAPTEHYSLEKPANTLRVMTLGGSTTWNARLPHNKKYPTVLQKILSEKYPNKNVEVINAGMDWYTTKHSLTNYVTNMADYNPDVVVIMHAINDLYRSFSPKGKAIGPYKKDWSHFYGPSTNGADPPTFEQHIYQRQLEETLKRWLFKWRYVEEDFPEDRFVSLPQFERHYDALISRVMADGAKVIVVSQPYLLKDEMSPEERSKIWFGHENCFYIENGKRHYASPASLAAAMNAYNDSAMRLGRVAGATIVEGEQALSKSLENFVDDVHYTPAGAQRLAKAVAEAI